MGIDFFSYDFVPTTYGTSENSWVADNITYSTSNSFAWVNSTMIASDATAHNFCQIYFLQKPTTSGTYDIATYYNTLTQTSSGNKAAIIMAVNSAQYWSTDASVSISVTVTGGIVTATFNNIILKNNADAQNLLKHREN